MKRIAFLTSTGTVVAAVTLLASTVPSAGGSAALAAGTKKSPSPTASPTPVLDGPGCFQVQDGTFFWHRDPVAPGSTAKGNYGEVGATVYLGAAYCENETYRFTLLDDATGTQVLKVISVKGSWPQVAAVTVTQAVHLGTTDAEDVNDDFKAVRLTLDILDANGNVVTSAPSGTTVVPGTELFDGDANTSPATTTFH